MSLHKRAYLWQFDQLGETSVEDIVRTLRLADIREVVVKTHQGETWTGQYDNAPLAIHSLDDVRARHLAFESGGVRMVPWCVPTGADVAGEAAFASDVARACDGTIELDVEPYRGFFDGPKENLLPLVQAIKDRGSAVDITLDARHEGVEPFGWSPVEAACGLADRVWAQAYWTDFGQNAGTVLQATFNLFDNLAIPVAKTGIIFPWDDPGSYSSAVALLSRAGVPAVGMWRMGTAGPAVYAALAQIPGEAPPSPAVRPPDVTPALDGLWDLSTRLVSYQHEPLAVELQQQVKAIKSALGLP